VGKNQISKGISSILDCKKTKAGLLSRGRMNRKVLSLENGRPRLGVRKKKQAREKWLVRSAKQNGVLSIKTCTGDTLERKGESV